MLKKTKMHFYEFRQNCKMLFYSILLFILFFSCLNKKIYDNIPENKKFKYKQGDTIIFLNNYNKYDTFRIGKTDISYDERDKDFYQEFDKVGYTHIGQLYDSILNKDNNVVLSDVGVGISWGDFTDGFGDDDTAKLSITFNNTTFENVHIIEKDTNSFYTRKNIYKVYLCRNYGVLKY